MFNEPTIESLNKEVKNLTSTIKSLEARFNAYDSSPYLDRNLDNQSKDILHQEVSKKIMDIVWDEYYHYHTFFEAVGTAGNYGWILSDSGGTSGVDSTGLFLATGTSTGNESFVVKAPLYQNILSFDLESRFRTSFYVDSVSNIRVFIGGGNGTSGGTLSVNLNYYGFYLENNTLYGVTSNGTTGSRVALISNVQADYLYLLEARYVPGNKVTFYVSEGTAFPNIPSINTRAKERGSLTTTLPSGDGTLVRFQIETRANAEKNLGIGFYEYIQQKIKP